MNFILEDFCVVEGDYVIFIVVINIDIGKVFWVWNFGGFDVFVLVCFVNFIGGNCFESFGLDYDFGELFMLLIIKLKGGESCDVVIVG